MSETIKDIAAGSRMSFYDKAAWYIVATPFLIVAIAYAALFVVDHRSLSRLEVDHADAIILVWALFLQFLSFILGFSICCRIRQHRRKLTIWLALIGVLASFGFGAFTLFALALSGMDSGC
jgi:hypothetical protein